jgi:cAMP phosphodiesterase
MERRRRTLQISVLCVRASVFEVPTYSRSNIDSFRLRTDDIYKIIAPSISVLTMPLSHGCNDTSGTYESSAFFIRHDPTGHEYLFFGDVEPDSIATKPQTINVWRVAAAKIADNTKLDAIFIECSWAQGRNDDVLYGHLSPEHLVVELTALATEVVKVRKKASSSGSNSLNLPSGKPKRKKLKSDHTPKSEDAEDLRGALQGVRVYVMHCKDTLDGAADRPVNHIIVDQVKVLVEARGLGADILATDQGMRIGA